MLRLYDATISGNCYKVRLLLSHLGRPYDKVPVDLLARDGRPEPVRRRHPTARVPLLQLDDGRFLAESNAILYYLAHGSPLLADDPYRRATTLQWMFFEQNHHEPTIAVARFVVRFLGADHPRAAALPDLRKAGRFALEVMDRRLAEVPFVDGDRFSIADIALFAYTHNAHEGGFDLEPHAHVRAWLERVAAQPGHEPMGA